MKYNNDLSAEYVRSILDYNPETGEIIWRIWKNVRPEWNTRYANKIAGKKEKDSRIRININRKLYLAHRIAWLIMTGEWPVHEIDHRDLTPDNNKWNNLRQANQSQNNCNHPIRKDNVSGLKCVFWDKSRGKWVAQIKINKIRIKISNSFSILMRILI